jgi:urease accessory protein
MKISKNLLPILAIVTSLAPTVVFAHNGEHTTSLFYGLQHPITGLDHILAMIAVGLIAFMIAGRSKILLPAMFVGTMIAGSVLGAYGLELPYIEQGILVSDFVLGTVLLLALKLPNVINYSMVGVFALFHGFAHGAEIPKDTNGLTYSIGFILATVSLHLLGMTTGYIAQNYDIKTQKLTYRIAGILVLFASTWLLYK